MIGKGLAFCYFRDLFLWEVFLNLISFYVGDSSFDFLDFFRYYENYEKLAVEGF